MYRRLSKRQQEARARKLESMRRGRDRARMERPAPGRAPELPELRREVIVIDYDSGSPVTNTLHLYRTRRVDTYRIEANGQPWKRGGPCMVLEPRRGYVAWRARDVDSGDVVHIAALKELLHRIADDLPRMLSLRAVQ